MALRCGRTFPKRAVAGRMRILRATSVDSFRAPPVKRRLLSLAVAASGLSLAVVQPVSPSAGTPGAREATVPPVDVVAYPGPGWRTASPSTSITFRGRAPAGLGAVRVVGSRSGSHQGRLVRSSVGLGATFRPATPFLPGERVTVTSAVRVLGSPSTRFSFTVGTPAPRAVRPPSEGDEAGSSSSLAARTGAAPSGSSQVPQPTRLTPGRGLYRPCRRRSRTRRGVDHSERHGQLRARPYDL